MKILIIEDNDGLLDNMVAYLEREGYIIETAQTEELGLDKIYDHRYDILLLDIMLPDGNGLDILRHLKQEQPTTGVLIISAKDALDDRVKGLEIGADDYLTKPFHLSELHARIKAIYRRNQLQGNETLTFEEITVEIQSRRVVANDQTIDLTRKEFDLLVYLITNKNHVLTKQSIAEHLWGDYVDHLENLDFVYQHIKNVRKKLMKAGVEDYIQTVYGLGYKFTQHV